MQKTIKDISADNQSVIMQVSPVLLDGMRGVKISYEVPYCIPSSLGSSPPDEVTLQTATGTVNETIRAAAPGSINQSLLTALSTPPSPQPTSCKEIPATVTMEMAIGKNHLYEVSYTYPSRTDLADVYEIEEIVNNTEFSRPFDNPFWTDLTPLRLNVMALK